MKKILSVLVLLLLFSALYAQDLKVGAGLDLGVAMDFYNASVMDGDMVLQMNHTMLLIGACVDATYVRLSLDYAKNIAQGGTGEIFGVEDDLEFPDDYSISHLYIDLLGKYPIDLGGTLIWPAAGIRYAMCLNWDADGDGENDLDSDLHALNDLYICAGVGADVTVGPVVVSPSVIFGYNLTPVMDKDYEVPDDESYSWFNLAVKVSVIYHFM